MSVLTTDELRLLIRFDGAGSETEVQQTLDAAEAIIAREVLPLVLSPATYAPDLKLAVAEKFRQLWRPRRGPSARGGNGDDGPSSAQRVDELLSPFIPPVTFA